MIHNFYVDITFNMHCSHCVCVYVFMSGRKRFLSRSFNIHSRLLGWCDPVQWIANWTENGGKISFICMHLAEHILLFFKGTKWSDSVHNWIVQNKSAFVVSEIIIIAYSKNKVNSHQKLTGHNADCRVCVFVFWYVQFSQDLCSFPAIQLRLIANSPLIKSIRY